jgi:hypothetical protein
MLRKKFFENKFFSYDFTYKNKFKCFSLLVVNFRPNPYFDFEKGALNTKEEKGTLNTKEEEKGFCVASFQKDSAYPFSKKKILNPSKRILKKKIHPSLPMIVQEDTDSELSEHEYAWGVG